MLTTFFHFTNRIIYVVLPEWYRFLSERVSELRFEMICVEGKATNEYGAQWMEKVKTRRRKFGRIWKVQVYLLFEVQKN